MSADRAKLLFVDDEPNLLNAFKRQFIDDYDIDIALGAEKALGYLERTSDYAVIVSDLRNA